LTKICYEENSVLTINKEGAEEQTPYDVLIMATGYNYNSPWRGDANKLLTHEERSQLWKEER